MPKEILTYSKFEQDPNAAQQRGFDKRWVYQKNKNRQQLEMQPLQNFIKSENQPTCITKSYMDSDDI